MRTFDLRSLDGKTVLVHSARDHHNPPSAVRGTIEIRTEAGGQRVAVVLEFPQMFATRAHRRTRLLAEEEVVRLLASENNGAFELTVPESLDPAAPAGDA
ncbi:MAG TPA: hypothetical protein VHD62_03500 [Opitutaceae bacterium]|nr:hypothetical protein [Opitutaceae bacterium]